MGLIKAFELSELTPPVLIAFDHLYSEYLSIKPIIDDPDEIEFIKTLPEKRSQSSLDWDDLYGFELILAKYLPTEKLRSKIMRLRYDYRSVAGQKEFDNYMASKPPDLQTPPEPTDPPHATEEKYERLLREDLKDLLGRMYLEYTILPVREERLTDLTWLAAKLCLISLIVLLVILGILFLIPLGYDMAESKADGVFALLNIIRTSDKLASLTIFVVVTVGAMGGFVSALQRIQSPPTEGDSLYNLSLLFYGSKSIFVAPISGSIFAIVLYLLFTSGVLTGAFFPSIYTPEGTLSELVVSPQQNSTQASEPVPAQKISNSNSATESATATKTIPRQGINVFDFLARSGPGTGKDYALLIVWCFIAGFAERFVPDALDRMIASGNPEKSK